MIPEDGLRKEFYLITFLNSENYVTIYLGEVVIKQTMYFWKLFINVNISVFIFC
jgi:hypothetical protein